MVIAPLSIAQSGPGVDLSNQAEGASLRMSDPVQDFEYARNAATFTYDLSGMEHVRLRFEAMEFGDEPHGPRKDEGGSEKVENEGVFGPVVGFDFDGVAVSADGVNWYEIQGLRGLRSDRYTAFDLDLDALVAAAGLSYGSAFGIRFCQYDDNPAPMDGVSLKGIELEGDGRPPVLHLSMNDNAADAVVLDAAAGHRHQVFVDPGGNPNTSAHSVPGVVGPALAFDGVDDRIVLSPESHKPCMGANRDFTIALWWKTNGPDAANTLYFLSNRMGDAENTFYWYTVSGNLYLRVRFVEGEPRVFGMTCTGGADDVWHRYVVTRHGTVLSFYRDGVLDFTNDHPENVFSLAPIAASLTIGSTPSGSNPSPGFADDFRVYDRALLASEIQELATHV